MTVNDLMMEFTKYAASQGWDMHYDWRDSNGEGTTEYLVWLTAPAEKDSDDQD